MKRKCLHVIVTIAVIVCTASILGSCASGPGVKHIKPQMLDYKDKKFGKTIPSWVTQEPRILESQKEYAGLYVFKFESPRGKSLEGVRSITHNLDVPQQIAQMASARMKSKASATATDTQDAVGQAVIRAAETIANVTVTGLRIKNEFWTQDRYFDEKGKVTGDLFTYYVLITIPQDIMNKIIKAELDKALSNLSLQSKEEQDAMQRAQDIFNNGLKLE